jgi:hypothetical protein
MQKPCEYPFGMTPGRIVGQPVLRGLGASNGARPLDPVPIRSSILLGPQPDHHLRERRGFHFLSIENCPNRFAIKTRLLSCFPQSTRADLCY